MDTQKHIITYFIISIILSVSYFSKAQKQFQDISPVHFSVVHSVSTDGSESNKKAYHFSFNMLSGSVGSVNGFEFGSLYNENKNNMFGVQMSGILNTTHNQVSGIQMGGIANISGEVEGVQLAGINNISKDLVGLQMSGIFNYADMVTGVQVGGIYNQAKILHGFQIGLVNVADTVSDGGGIGLLNLYKKGGYREIEISVADYSNLQIAYKSGTKRLYTILSLGYNFNPESLFASGFGIGCIKKMNTNWNFRPELVWYNYYTNNLKNPRNTNSLHLKIGFMRKINSSLAFTIMPSIYAGFKQKKDDLYGYKISSIAPISSNINTNNAVEFGLGLGIGISFLK
jgi:hypothetical protein